MFIIFNSIAVYLKQYYGGSSLQGNIKIEQEVKDVVL